MIDSTLRALIRPILDLSLYLSAPPLPQFSNRLVLGGRPREWGLGLMHFPNLPVTGHGQ